MPDIHGPIREMLKGLDDIRNFDKMTKLAFDISPIGMELYDRDGVLIEVNAACLDIFGVEDQGGLSGFKLFEDPNVSDSVKSLLLNCETVKYVAPFSFDAVAEKKLYSSKKTGVIYIYVIIVPLAGPGSRPAGYLVLVQDVTDQKRAEEELKFLSLHDSLTGLYNRSYFEQEMERVQNGRYSSAAVVVCDVDGLKSLNDTRGHETGDVLLREAASAIQGAFRTGDMVARIGGDEFAAVIPNCSRSGVEGIKNRIERNISSFNSAGNGFTMSISIGFSFGDGQPLDMEGLFREADRRMYGEKRNRKK